MFKHVLGKRSTPSETGGSWTIW